MKKAIEIMQKIQIAIGGFFLCVFLLTVVPVYRDSSYLDGGCVHVFLYMGRVHGRWRYGL